MEEKFYESFLAKYVVDKHTASEHEQFLKWYQTLSEERAEQVMHHYLRISGEVSSARSFLSDADLIEKIEARLDQHDALQAPSIEIRPLSGLYIRRIAAAAMLLLIGGGAYYLYSAKFANQSGHAISADLFMPVPGGNRALLTLADGSTINLNDAGRGEIASQAGIRIQKVSDGQLVYAESSAEETPVGSLSSMNMISTPKSGQYRIHLSDGTEVWLNALSSIRFPAVFKANERSVEITGEAYFEVASRKNRGRKVPFRVVCNNQIIEVLGTHFNVNSYGDESVVKTTLLEGSVKVSSVQDKNGVSGAAVKLRPGEQSIVKQLKGKASSIAVERVDIESAIAWKDGYFKFKDTDIQEVMRQLSRWYDLDVVYNGDLPKDQFTGFVSKKVSVHNVLSILEEGGGVQFSIKGNKVEVTALD